MAIPKILESDIESPKPKNSLKRLGLTMTKLQGLNGKVLDIGCGRSASLVYLLKQNDIAAEGIDPLTRNEPFLMQRKVCEPYPGSGSIPRPDETYKLVIVHTNPSLYVFVHPLETLKSSIKRERRDASDEVLAELVSTIKTEAYSIITEALRVMTPDGRLVLYPSLPSLMEYEASIEQAGFTISTEGIRISTRDLELERALMAANSKDQLKHEIFNQIFQANKKRTIIQRK